MPRTPKLQAQGNEDPTRKKLRRGLGNRAFLTRPADTLADKERIERAARALELRIVGASYEVIARETGVSLTTAHHDVKFALSRHKQEEVEEMRKVLNAQLDDQQVRLARVLGPMTKKAEAGSTLAAAKVASLTTAATRITLAKAKVNGVIVPVKQELEVRHQHTGVVATVIAALPADRIQRYLELGAGTRVPGDVVEAPAAE